jgi:hypothetical protein
VALISELDAADFDVSITGFDAAEVDELLDAFYSREAVQDNFDEQQALQEVKEKGAVTKLGDIWQLGEHLLLCGDSTKEADFKRVMGGERAQVAVTSPPYGVGKEYEKKGIEPWVEVIKPVVRNLTKYAGMPVREKVIEEEFVKALNGLVKNRDEVVKVVGESVNYALAETGEDIDKSDELREIDDTIETLQAQILEINKQRIRREIDQEQYNNGSRKVMAKLDTLFIERDKILSEQKTATLSKAFQAVVAEFINRAGEQAEFDKDIFTRLVDKICIKGREKIVFVMKDGTEVKNSTDGLKRTNSSNC